MKSRFLDEAGDEDPLLSLVNLIDVFLVLIAGLLLAQAKNPLNAMGDEKVTLIRQSGENGMEVIIKEGQHIQRFKADGKASEGKGVKAGVAYRMADGSLVYVPEN